MTGQQKADLQQDRYKVRRTDSPDTKGRPKDPAGGREGRAKAGGRASERHEGAGGWRAELGGCCCLYSAGSGFDSARLLGAPPRSPEHAHLVLGPQEKAGLPNPKPPPPRGSQASAIHWRRQLAPSHQGAPGQEWGGGAPRAASSPSSRLGRQPGQPPLPPDPGALSHSTGHLKTFQQQIDSKAFCILAALTAPPPPQVIPSAAKNLMNEINPNLSEAHSRALAPPPSSTSCTKAQPTQEGPTTTCQSGVLTTPHPAFSPVKQSFPWVHVQQPSLAQP